MMAFLDILTIALSLSTIVSGANIYLTSFEPGAVDNISRCLLGLIGLGIPGSENHIATPVSRFWHYSA